MKDNFSTASDKYAQYRPDYPGELFDVLFNFFSGREAAWDCGTGSGQVAVRLAPHFRSVEATDISKAQLENAHKHKKVHYSVQPAEQTNFPDQTFDLITVAQAIHWFDFDKFYSEVYRTLKPDGLFAVLGYGLFRTDPETDKLIAHLYVHLLGKYWDPERKYIDQNYRTIPFPFEEYTAPQLNYTVAWDTLHLTGYMRTWSAVKHFMENEGYDPVDEIEQVLLEKSGPTGMHKVSFPILCRLGKLK